MLVLIHLIIHIYRNAVSYVSSYSVHDAQIMIHDINHDRTDIVRVKYIVHIDNQCNTIARMASGRHG